MKGIRPMEKKDSKDVHRLITEYLTRFKIAPVFTEDEVEHYFVPRPGVIDSFVVEVNRSAFYFFVVLIPLAEP